MLKRVTIATALAALTLSFTAYADVQVRLGSKERVTHLFAYPNNCGVICFKKWTLEETVENYVAQSVVRDGYSAAKVEVHQKHHEIVATISGVPDGYGESLSALLNAGDLAYKDAKKLNADGQWKFNWYLFLPLGMALENRKSVELLHFPPDTALTQYQDYLNSATTNRWSDLLIDNGIAPDQTPSYQTIIDIAPIAAPASAGNDLVGTYSYFTDYQTTVIKQLTLAPDGKSLPMVAFGTPVRNWLQQQYGVTVPVLGLASLDMGTGKSVAVLGSNHPSYIWYAAGLASNGGDQHKADVAGLKVMGQDLSAACWQAGMGKTPGTDAQAMLSQCTQQWQVTNKAQTCELFYTSIRLLTADQAKTKCTASDVSTALEQLQQPISPQFAQPYL